MALWRVLVYIQVARLRLEKQQCSVLLRCKSKREGSLRSYFCRALCLQADNGFRQKCEPDSKCDCILKMGSITRTRSAKQKGHSYECPFRFAGDPYGNRTHDSALRGLRLSRLTNGPFLKCLYIISYVF